MERQLAIAKPTLVSYMHYVLPNSFSPFMYLELSPFLPKIISLSLPKNLFSAFHPLTYSLTII